MAKKSQGSLSNKVGELTEAINSLKEEIKVLKKNKSHNRNDDNGCGEDGWKSRRISGHEPRGEDGWKSR
jgi:hypothetical protein